MRDRILRLFASREISKCQELQASLIYSLCSSSMPELKNKEDYLAEMILNGGITDKQQLKLAEIYFERHKEFSFDEKTFQNFCGVGLPPVEPEAIQEYVRGFIMRNISRIAEHGGKISHPSILNDLKEGMLRANPVDLMRAATTVMQLSEVENALQSLSLQVKDNKNSEDSSLMPKNSLQSSNNPEKTLPEEPPKFQKINLDKLAARDLPEFTNSAEALTKHAAQTAGRVITRFPPEPNGVLHIGHARAIRFNFSIAGVYGGDCNLRYDDTNPEKEKKEFMDMIEENVTWMGFKPTKVVHTSHYFPQIYEYTIQLIKMGKAYVCHLSAEEQKELREKCIPSPYRNRSAAENLREFERMLRGYYGEGEAVLRAKIDYLSPNTTLRDPSLYRITYTPHPVTGSEWCIYPLYDYSHAISDSIENITHSCCTLEFETRRDLYYWPLNQLGLYKPFVWEFSRLNLTYTITSKRKIQIMIDDG